METFLIKTVGFLAKQFTECIHTIWENEEKIKRLAETVEHIRYDCDNQNRWLSDVHDKQFEKKSVNNGYKRLREAFLDAEDFLDRVETRRKKREARDAKLKEEKEDIKKMDGQVQQFLASCQVQTKSIFNKVTRGCSKYNPANAMKVNNEIEEIKKALEAFSKNLKDYGLKEATTEPDVTHNARSTGSRVDATEIIGRDQIKSEIVSLLLALSNDQKAIRAVSIIGMGGMGKTTLAQLVFNDIKSQEGCKFDRYMWASDCKKFELKGLLKKLLLSIDSKANLNNKDSDNLSNRFARKIRGKKVFLVLDDVEVEDDYIWEKLRLLLKEGNMEESRILVTARSQAVASCIGENNSIRQLKGLSEDDSWSLFERCAFSSARRDDSLIEMGKDIVKRCMGVPLAIKVIGSYLKKHQNKRTWEHVRDCGLKKEDDYIIPILKISYDGLDSTLKQCFSLCALFPKNWEISPKLLSNIWISNVHFEAKEGITLQEVCNDKLEILCERFFLEKTNNGSYFKMHDLMHDLSTKVAGEEILVVEDLKSVVVEKNVLRHLTLHSRVEYDAMSTFLKAKGKRLRTFLRVNHSWYPRGEILIVDKLVTACPVLRVLILQNMDLYKLPDSIKELIHLRYLDISWNEFETLPDSVTELINLRYLNLGRCSLLTCLPKRMDALTSLEELNLKLCYKLEQLPTGLGKLTNLRYLNLRFCKSLTSLPDRIDALTSLEELNLSNCFKLEQLPTGIVTLAKLRYLKLKFCKSLTCLPDRIDALTSLEELNLKWCSKLEQLPTGIVTLAKLRYLNLSWCSSLTCLPDRIDALTSLEKLKLSRVQLEQLPTGIGKLTNLRCLNLRWCSSLNCLPDRIDALTSLEELDLSLCYKLEQLPTGIVKLTNLKNLNIEDCNSLTEMPSGMGALMPVCTPSKFIVGHLESKHSAQLQELGLLSELKEGKLTIQLPSKTALKVVWDCEAYLINKKWLRDLEIVWEDKEDEDMEKNHIDILAKLQPPTDIDKLSLFRYQGRNFPPWVPRGDFASVLPNLVEMRLKNCGKCRHLPPLSRLPCLRSLFLEDLRSLEYIEEDNIVSTVSFCPSLEILHLSRLPKLKGWCRGLGNSGHEESLMLPSFPQLNSLTIKFCSNLRVSPMLLSFVKVFDSSQISSVSLFDQVCRNSGWFTLSFNQEIGKHSWDWKISNFFDSAESSSIYTDEAFRGLSDRVTHLTIWRCSGLKTLPRGLQCLTALQKLVIAGCNDFTWEDEDKQILEHQQKCSDGEMSSKPFKSLQVLTLRDLPMMVRMPNWIQLVTSLRELTLENLPRMETLPEWIQLLTNLQQLAILRSTNFTIPVFLQTTFEKKEKYDGDYFHRVKTEEHNMDRRSQEVHSVVQRHCRKYLDDFRGILQNDPKGLLHFILCLDEAP